MKENTTKKQWYDRTALVIVLTIIIPPVGFYGLYKSSSLQPKYKWIIFGVYAGLIMIGSLSPSPKPGSNIRDTTSQSLPQNGEHKGFEIKGDEASMTENLGQIIDVSNTVMEIGDHVTKYMKKVMNDNKLNKLREINLNYEVKNFDNPNYRIATLTIPVVEWKQIPENLRENEYWVMAHLENWKKVINYELVMEIRKRKNKYDQ